MDAEDDKALEPDGTPADQDLREEPAGSAVVEGAAADPLATAEAEAARWKDRCIRTAADLDNFRKRSRRDIDDSYRKGREDLLRDLLPVFDNLERAVAHAGAATDVKSLVDGIQMVMRLFTDTLARLGIERTPGVGQPFDPAVHEAIQHLETDEHPPGTVAAEVLPGYRMGDHLVRAAMVVVARGRPAAPSVPEPTAGTEN
jgi:molecular chaperone GrpE